MKVFFDHQIYVLQQFGGISRYFNELMKMEVGQVEIEKLDPAVANLNYGMKTDIVNRGINYMKRKSGLGTLPGKQDAELRIQKQITASNFTIFHPTYYDPYFLQYLNKPFVLTVYDMIHEIYREYFPPSDPTTHNKKLLCDRASAIIAISENTKKDLINIFQIPAEKVHAIPLASDFDKVEAVPPARMPVLENYILFVGNRWGYKNFYFPVIALAEILRNDRQMHLLCTGHEFTESELQFFRDLGIAEKVKQVYLKNDNELAWVYQHASLFIFPSLYEGFGFPILEAFASKCPVIASNGGSLPEVGGNGVLYFNPKEITSINDAAKKVLYDTELKKDLVQKGTAVFNQFSWDKCRQQTLKLYKSLSYSNE